MSASVKNTGRVAGELENQFRERRQEAPPQGYVSQDGAPQTERGDAEAPWIKVPPFTTQPVPWCNFVLSATEYVPTPEIEIFQQRVIQVFFRYNIVGDAGILSTIAENKVQIAAGEDPADAWYTTTLVDPTPTVFSPPGTRFPAGGFISRTFSPSELRTQSLSGPSVARFLLAFDVSTAVSFRLNLFEAAEGEDENEIELFYSLSV